MVSEHVMKKDPERRKIVCATCGVPWPCETKQAEILAKIKQEAQQA